MQNVASAQDARGETRKPLAPFFSQISLLVEKLTNNLLRTREKLEDEKNIVRYHRCYIERRGRRDRELRAPIFAA